jgi:hypothetical protein
VIGENTLASHPVTASFDFLFLACGLFICSYFKTLQKRLENLTPGDANSKINEIIEDHNRILKIFEDFNKAFAPILIEKFMLTAILICVLGFQLLVVSFLEIFFKFSVKNSFLQSDDIPKMISSVLFLICTFIGLFIYCVISTWIQMEVIF